MRTKRSFGFSLKCCFNSTIPFVIQWMKIYICCNFSYMLASDCADVLSALYFIVSRRI